MSGVVGVFALGGSQIPCEPRIKEMVDIVSKEGDHSLSFSDHRLRLEILIDPSLYQSSFQCAESGCFTWLWGHFDNKSQLISRVASEGAEVHNSAELLTRLYQSKGLLATSMLKGAFAALIWDPAEHRFLMLRDPLGVKSIYFSRDGDTLWFSTESRALIEQQPQINLAALHGFLLTGSAPLGHTLLRKIESVQPGELVVCERGQLKRTRYWFFVYEQQSQLFNQKDYQGILTSHIDMILDRIDKKPVAVVSGGETGLLEMLFQNQSRYPVREIDFCGLRQSDNDEVEQELGTVSIGFRDLVKLWGQPFHSLAELVQAHSLCRERQSQVIVSPLGESVLFGRHSRYRELRWVNRHQRAMTSFQATSAVHDRFHAVRSMVSEFALAKQYLNDEFLAEVEREGFSLHHELLREWGSWSAVGQLQAGLMQWQVQPLLAPLSRLSLTRGITFEFPYLAVDAVENLLTIDASQHLRGVIGGQLLERAFGTFRADVMPNSRPFTASKQNLMNSFTAQEQVLLIEAREILRDSNSLSLLFDQREVDALLQRTEKDGNFPSPDLRSLVLLASIKAWLEH